MQQISKEEIINKREALGKIITESASIINAMGNVPLEDSIADLELKNYKRIKSIKTAHDQAYQRMETAADLMSCLIKSLTEPVETVAPYVLTRGVLESSAYSTWLGRPDISADERVNRSLAMRLKNLREQTLLSEAEPQINGPSQEKYENLASIAKELNAEIKTKNGRLTMVGTQLPVPTVICESELREGATYRILSGVSHSRSFAIQQLCFRTIGPSDQDADRLDSEKFIPPMLVAILFVQAGKAFLTALCARLKIYGFLTREVIQMLRKHSDVLELKEEYFRRCIWAD